ncbi:hypothetical protein C8J98_10514 [Luteibacter sp. OK325]|nr:hypothetical protein C8J98_10514 [Luteibacter sp. OK325]
MTCARTADVTPKWKTWSMCISQFLWRVRTLFSGSSRITGDRAGSASRSLSTLGRVAGETLVPTLAAQTILRVREGKTADAAHVSIWPTAAPLVRNSPRGWTPRPLTTIRWSGRRAVGWCRRRPPAIVGAPGRCGGGGWHPAVEHLPRARAGMPADDAAVRFGSTHANLRARESLRCPPSRRVPHKWSGRRPIRTRPHSGLSGTKRGGLSEQRGWAPKALRCYVTEGSAPRRPRPPRRRAFGVPGIPR